MVDASGERDLRRLERVVGGKVDREEEDASLTDKKNMVKSKERKRPVTAKT